MCAESPRSSKNPDKVFAVPSSPAKTITCLPTIIAWETSVFKASKFKWYRVSCGDEIVSIFCALNNGFACNNCWKPNTLLKEETAETTFSGEDMALECLDETEPLSRKALTLVKCCSRVRTILS